MSSDHYSRFFPSWMLGRYWADISLNTANRWSALKECIHYTCLFPTPPFFFSLMEHKAVHNVQSDKCSTVRQNPSTPPTPTPLYTSLPGSAVVCEKWTLGLVCLKLINRPAEVRNSRAKLWVHPCGMWCWLALSCAAALEERTLRLSDAVVSWSSALHHPGEETAAVLNPSSPGEHRQSCEIYSQR